MTTRIGPRWLTLVILAYGILEIPWVIYLVFFQERTGTAHHTHLAAAGMSIGAAVLAGFTAVGAQRCRPWAAAAGSMTATWLLAGVFNGLVLTHVSVVYAAIPGILAAAVIVRDILNDQRPHPGWALLLALVGVFMLLHLVWVATHTNPSFHADHLRFLVVVYDSAEVASLLGLGLSLRAGAARAAIVFGSAGAVLFVLDAWINLTVVGGGQAFAAAVFYAIVGEIPAITMCLVGVWFAMHHWRALSASHPPEMMPT